MDLSFYDLIGRPYAYSEDGETIFTYAGQPIAYIEGDSIYSFSGVHLGFFEQSQIWDHDGSVLLFCNSASGGPLKPLKELKPLMELKQLKPLKEMKQVNNYRLEGGSLTELSITNRLSSITGSPSCSAMYAWTISSVNVPVVTAR